MQVTPPKLSAISQELSPTIKAPSKAYSDKNTFSNEDKQAFARYINAGTAENTRKAYQSGMKHYIQWGGVLPATPSDVTHYLITFAETHAPQTLSLRLAALSQWHQIQGFQDPCQHTSVRKILRGIKRTKQHAPKKAKAMSLKQIQQVIDLYDSPEDTHSSNDLDSNNELQLRNQLRNKALISIGFFAALRRSELISLAWRDIQWQAEGVIITLQSSKTDQHGQHISKAIPISPNTGYCPISHLAKWQKILERDNPKRIDSNNPVFVSINRWGHFSERALSAHSVNLIIQQLAKRCNWPQAEAYSGHSLRRGFSTSAARAGAPFSAIKKQGGWSHDATVQGYIEEGNLFENCAPEFLLRS